MKLSPEKVIQFEVFLSNEGNKDLVCLPDPFI